MCLGLDHDEIRWISGPVAVDLGPRQIPRRTSSLSHHNAGALTRQSSELSDETAGSSFTVGNPQPSELTQKTLLHQQHLQPVLQQGLHPALPPVPA
jgi:hypothetical protein